MPVISSKSSTSISFALFFFFNEHSINTTAGKKKKELY